jgi:uroporphyrin-III C-methyltransferase/precorrin-2 dehydrogenase/sirohydrochlorin ferrochelatase
MDYLPIFLRVQNRLAVVIGGGAVAARKAELLLRCGAHVRLVAPELGAGTQQLLREPTAATTMSHLCASFTAQHLDGAVLVIAATDSDAVNAQVSRLARERGLPVNVADDAELSDFILPAIVDRDPVIVAVSSAGTTPVLARRVREQIEALLPARLGALARFAGSRRGRVNEVLQPALRRDFWERFFGSPANLERLVQDEPAAARAFTEQLQACGDRNDAAAPGTRTYSHCAPCSCCSRPTCCCMTVWSHRQSWTARVARPRESLSARTWVSPRCRRSASMRCWSTMPAAD